MRADQVRLVGANGSLTLTRARISEVITHVDVDVFRAPFGRTPHSVGSGRDLPSVLTIRGALEGVTRAENNDLLGQLRQLLPEVTLLEVGEPPRRVTVLGGSGSLVSTPTRMGWAVTLQLIDAGQAWTL